MMSPAMQEATNCTEFTSKATRLTGWLAGILSHE